MNDNVKSLLRGIALHLRALVEGDEFAAEDLQETLLASGTSADELEAALDAILALSEPSQDDLPEHAAGSPRGHRVLSLEERSRLTPEAFGYLLGVRGGGSIDDEQFEWVLERAIASGERRIGLDEIQDLVLEATLGGDHETGGERGEIPGVH